MLYDIPSGPLSGGRSNRSDGLRMKSKALFMVLAFGLASCATTPENLFVPVAETAPGASKVDMLVATTRRAAGDPGELYSGERSDALSFAAQ